VISLAKILFSLSILGENQKVKCMKFKIINCPHCGKIIPEHILNGGSTRKTVTCPDCGSQRNCKDGTRNTTTGKIQLYLCHDCGHRYSENPAKT
jgi:transposase-like protein